MAAGFLFVVNTGAAAWLATRWSRRLLPDAGGTERVLSAFVLFASLTQGILMLVGLVGALTVLPVTGLLGALVLLPLVFGRHRAAHQTPSDARTASRWPLPALAVAGIACGWSAWTVLGSGTVFGFDDLTYHAVSPAWWLQAEALVLAPFNYQAYYPMNAELAALWFMLAHRIDAHANLAMLVWLGILVAAWAVHARRLGQMPLFTAAAMACFLFSPEIQERLPYFTSGDLAMAGLISAMLAFTWVPGENGRAVARAFLSGLAGGLAVGMKPTAAPHVIIAGIAWVVRRRSGGSTVLARVSAFSLGVVLMGSFWYFRNLVLTGNPLFPAEMGPFEGPFSREAQAETSLAPMMIRGWAHENMWLRFFEEYLAWPLPLGLLALAGLGIGAWAAFRNRDATRRGHLRLLAGCGLLFVLMFPMQPFSATVNRPDAPPFFLVRYVTFPFLVGLMLLPSVLSHRTREGAASAAIGCPRVLGLLAGFVVLSCIALSTPRRAAATTENLFAYQESLRPGREAFEGLPDGTRVVLDSYDPPSHALMYPLFGRRLQLRPLAVNKDGTARLPLHDSWRTAPSSWWWEFDPGKKRPAGRGPLAVLAEQGAQVLILQDWPLRSRNRGPTPMRWAAKRLGPERLFYSDDTTEIWKLQDELESSGRDS